MRIKILIIILFINSCSYPEIIRDELFYDNDFETNSLLNIDGGGFKKFNNSTVLGDFNNDGFTIHLDNVGDHEYIFVSFDLYIHGTWDGNFNGFSDNDKADKWSIELKPDMDLYKNPSSEIFTTTFSNSSCWPNYCLRQSYPQVYPAENNPKKGSFITDIGDKLCNESSFGGPSTLYKIEKGFQSRGDAIVLRFYDELYQPNAIDKYGNPQEKCDESWSIDNIKIRVISYK